MSYGSGSGNLVYYVIGFESGWLDHELYFHGFKYLDNQDWWHNSNFDIRKSIEFKNANRRIK